MKPLLRQQYSILLHLFKSNLILPQGKTEDVGAIQLEKKRTTVWNVIVLGLLLILLVTFFSPTKAAENPPNAITSTATTNATKKAQALIPILNFLLENTKDSAPTITLIGAQSITIKQGNLYIDAGATAKDREDGNIAVITKGIEAVDTATVGTYIVEYTAIDSAKHRVTKKRTVLVVAEELTTVKIVEASSLDSDKVTVSWMATEDDNTLPKDLLYTVHLSKDKNFQPNASTKNTQVKGKLSAVATKLTANTAYYVRVVAKNQKNKESWSDILLVKTVALTSKRSNQVVVVQNTQTPIVRENSIIFQDKGDALPQIGDVISNVAGISYLRKVKGVMQKDGQVTVETEPASVTDVFEDLDIATTVKIRPVSQQTRQLARKKQATMQMKMVGTQQHIAWQDSGLTLTSEVAAPARHTQKTVLQVADIEIKGNQQIKTGSHGQLQAPAYLSTAPNTSLFFKLEAKTTQVSNDWEVCKIALDKIKHDNAQLQAIAKPEVGKTVITDAEQRGTLNVSWTPTNLHLDSEARPYHFIFTLFIDDKGEGCNGDNLTALWDETITVDVPIYITFGEEDAQAKIDKKKITFTGGFSVEDTATVEFIPELSIAARIKKFKLQSALIKVSADIILRNELLITANKAAHLNAEQVLIAPRKFIKVFVTPAGIPVVVGGEFSLNAQIEGNVTGAMRLKKRLELSFPNTSFGMEYDASRTQKWQAVKHFQPRYEFNLSGDADASADITVTLIPDFQIHFYDAAAGRMLVEPYAYAETDLHGQFRYLDDSGSVSYDLDYWFNRLEAGAGVNLKLYAGLEIFNTTLVSYPKDASRDDPATFAQFSPIDKTPLWGLPTLSTATDNERFLATDSRSLLVTGTAKDIPFPFGDKKSLNTFTNWSSPKVLFPASQTEVPFTTASLVKQDATKAGNYWFKYTKAGKYIARLGGYSEGGSWLRQKIDIEIDLSDNDKDGMPDAWETTHGVSDPDSDPDDDKLTNLQEFKLGRFPKKADNPEQHDRDKDGMPDQWEQDNGLDPDDPSDAGKNIDGDYLTNLEEYKTGTNPRVAEIELRVTQQDQTIYFKWTPLPTGVSRYFLYLAEEPFSRHDLLDSRFMSKKGAVIQTVKGSSFSLSQTKLNGNQVTALLYVSDAKNHTLRSLSQVVSSHFLAPPQNLNARAGDQHITLTWDKVTDADKYTVYKAEEAGITPSNYSVYEGGEMLEDKTSPLQLSQLINNKPYYFIVTASKGEVESIASAEINATPKKAPLPTGKLNDTGITRCGDASSNDVDCPVADYPNQDAENGTNSMSFTKIAGGQCVQDNTTGLMWEVKQDKNEQHGDSLHDTDDRYNWYNPDNKTNGGNAGYQDNNGAICYGYQNGHSPSYCNTHAYVQRVNAQGWCGYSDWRLPTVQELGSLVSYNRTDPAIDTRFFPNTILYYYWSSSSDASSSDSSWVFSFGFGHNDRNGKNDHYPIRLVRNGQ